MSYGDRSVSSMQRTDESLCNPGRQLYLEDVDSSLSYANIFHIHV